MIILGICIFSILSLLGNHFSVSKITNQEGSSLRSYIEIKNVGDGYSVTVS